MENQTPSPSVISLPSSEQHAIIPYNQNIFIPQININNPQPTHHDDDTSTNLDEVETGDVSGYRISLSSFRIPNLLEELQRHYPTEKLLAVTFIWIMGSTSVCHAVYGFDLLDKSTSLSNSISPIAMSLFKYSLAIFVSVSLACGDIYHRSFETTYRQRRYFGMWLALPLAHLLAPMGEKYLRMLYYTNDVIYIAFMGGFNGQGKFVKFVLYWILQTIVLPMELGGNMSSDLVLVIAILTSFRATRYDIERLTSYVSQLLHFFDKNVQKLLPLVTAVLKSKFKEKKGIGKLVKYAIGLWATLLFQNFFRLTTFGEVKAFMHLAISWLANLTLINASHDFGILNFLLGNMVLGSTVGQSGLGITTWFTYAICLFLYILGMKLKSMKSNYQNLENWTRPPIIFWILYCCAVFDSIFNLIHNLK